ncbi:putative trans-sialidase, Group V [Trypanosoma cruzi]|nr:putative trans-sialidase, Group V [Trypanosoma cruzi]
MLLRVAAVKASRTHNRRRVTGSRGRRREGRESEPQRPNMSRRVFASAVLLLLVVMVCCGTVGAVKAEVEPTILQEPVPKSPFVWRDTTGDETVSSLLVPVLVEVNGKVFAVAEAQCTKGETTVFTGIAFRLLTMEKGKEPEELLKDAKKDTQVLEEVTSTEKKEVDVSRPTAVVEGSDIYMLVGKHNHDAADTCQADAEKIKSGMLLVKGEVGEGGNKINWNDTDGVPCTLGAEHESLTGLVGGGGSGVKLKDGKLVFPVEGTKKKDADTEEDEKTVSLIIYSSDTTSWTLSKGMSADGCSDPSVVEWKGKLMTMTACDDGRRRVYEIGDKGNSWTEALGTLSRVWGNNRKLHEKGVGSGFITAKIGNRNVMLVTLPVYSKEEDNSKGVLHLWLTDNTHIVDIGLISGKDDDDVAASSLLYRSGNNKEELIALYEKKKVDADTPSPGMFSVRLTEQLKRVRDVLTTWKEVDERVSKLCPSENAEKDASTATACSNTVKITDGLVGFLSGNFSGDTWKDEYLGVNATVTKEEGATVATENPDGVRFTGRGAWAEWPVGRQGENQLYHFANYNFTLVATVSIDKVPKEGSPIPLMGATMNDDENTVLFGLSYNREKKWILLCGGRENKGHSSPWKPDTQYQVAIVLQNGNQGSVYVDGQRVGGDEECTLGSTKSQEISHFYIGGDEGSAGSQEGVSVTVRNVLLYNRPLSLEEIGALNPNKAPISPLVKEPSSPSPVASDSIIPPIPTVNKNAQIAGTSSIPAGTHRTQQGQSMGISGADSGGASTSAVSAVSTPSAEKDSVKQAASGKSSDGAQTVDGGSTADGEPTMEKREGTDGQKEEVQPVNRDENATALNSSLGKLSQGNNSDAATVRGNGLLPSLLLLLGLWGFAPL